MATRKQVEESFGRIQALLYRLQNELLTAQRKGMVDSVSTDKYRELSPMFSFYELTSRIEDRFRNPIANAVMNDIRAKRRK